jgi:hypothetical protein
MPYTKTVHGVIYAESTGYCRECKKEMGIYNQSDIMSLARQGVEEKKEKEREKWLEEL